MTKISNDLVAYKIKSQLVGTDYFPITDSEVSNLKTRSADFNGVATFVASTLVPEQGGILKITEIDIDALVTDISTTVNLLSPSYLVARYEQVYFFIEGVVYVLKTPNITIGVGGTTTTNDDFITFPINSGIAGLNADMTRQSVTSTSIVSSGSKSLNFTSASSNLGWLVGTRLRYSHDANNYMEGVITAVSTTAVTITVDNNLGSGTFATWNIGIAGDKGASGRGIVDIALTDTHLLVDTYTITYTDATTYNYTVVNGQNGTNANMTRTSTTSNAIASTGSKTFTYSASQNLGWLIGTRLRTANSPTQYMEGTVTAVSSTSVTITVDNFKGTGTYTSWNIGIAGDKGIDANSVNLQKIIDATIDFPAGGYPVTSADNNYTIVITDDGSDGDIEIPAGLPENFICRFIQKDSAIFTFVATGIGVVINTPIGLKIKGQNYAVAIQQIGVTNKYFLLGNTKA